MKTGDLVVKDPDATSWPKGIDWTDYCNERATTISVSTWAISPASMTEASSSIVTGSLKTQILLTGGTSGLRYTVTNRITTAAGGTDDRSFFVLVQDR